MIPSQLLSLANHLWQTTLFVGAAGLLTLVLRKNSAYVRYWVWIVASVKFLIPFSVLMDIGGLLSRHTAAAVSSAPVTTGLSFAIEQVSEPFTLTAREVAIPRAHWSYTGVIVPVLIALWAVGFAWFVLRWALHWRRVRASVRTASSLHLPIGWPVKSSPEFGEPGVFGVVRPVLLLPDGILDCLAPPEMDAIVAHELCHIRRRYNLVTAVHMAVESLFWFHPLVWWVGARLMEERERACDEDVLQTGGDPLAYAEGILKICELYLASPLACVAGVTGANLKRRIQAILSGRNAADLTFAKKVFLAAAGLAALATPLVIGMISVRPVRAQLQAAGATQPAFEVASVKRHPDTEGPRDRTRAFEPGKITCLDITLGELIVMAYGIRPYQISGPGWIKDRSGSDVYDVIATTGNPAPVAQVKRMLGPLLADRFHLVFHRETRQLPVFALLVAKGGPKFKEPGDGGAYSISPDGEGGISFKNWSMDDLADWLANQMRRPVIDHTGLAGTFSFHGNLFNLEKGTPPDEAKRTMVNSDAVDGLRATLPQQLGLKLEAQRAPIEVVVIDHAERVPTEN